MERLLETVTAVVCLVSPEKVRALAGAIRRIGDTKATTTLSDVVGTAAAKAVVERFVEAWRATPVDSAELASMLLAASHAFENVSKHQSTELVWTGPTTPFVSARRTEQALLQVIGAAKQTLFVTSFVAYDVSTIVKALNDASTRGVSISMLLESSQDHGGSMSFDVIGKMRALVPTAKLYAWRERSGFTPKPRTVVKGWKTSSPAWRPVAASSGCGTARCIRTHRPLPHRVSSTSCDGSAHA